MRHCGCGLSVLPKHYMRKGMKYLTSQVKLKGMGGFGVQKMLPSEQVPSGSGMKRTTLKFKM